MNPGHHKQDFHAIEAGRPWYHMAWVLALLFGSVMTAAEPVLVELKLPVRFDPFGVDANAQYSEAARAACAVPKPDGFIGYRWTLPPVASLLRVLTGSSAGKQIYIGFLKSKYGYQIAAVNKAYGLDAQSFTELLESPMVVRGTAVDRDDTEFESEVRREMVNDIRAALMRCDPAHADGGLRMLLYLMDISHDGFR